MVTAVVVMILGHYGCPSSTSTSEAFFRILRWSSTPLGSQVVHPRNPRSGRRLDCFVRMEISSNLLFDLDGNARRLSASGGRAPTILDCLSLLSVRWFYVKVQALLSNTRFFSVSVVKGLYVICTHHVLE
jgi:hypothetical protein